MIIVYMIKVNANLSCLETFGILYLSWAWSSDPDLERQHDEVIMLIIVNYGVNHGNMMLDDLFESS